jgi:pyruvate,orthophosphate dikinase
MFNGLNSEAPLAKLRKMILSDTVENANSPCKNWHPMLKPLPNRLLKSWTVCLLLSGFLNPPLHEFCAINTRQAKGTADELALP